MTSMKKNKVKCAQKPKNVTYHKNCNLPLPYSFIVLVTSRDHFTYVYLRCCKDITDSQKLLTRTFRWAEVEGGKFTKFDKFLQFIDVSMFLYHLRR